MAKKFPAKLVLETSPNSAKTSPKVSPATSPKLSPKASPVAEEGKTKHRKKSAAVKARKKENKKKRKAAAAPPAEVQYPQWSEAGTNYTAETLKRPKLNVVESDFSTACSVLRRVVDSWGVEVAHNVIVNALHLVCTVKGGAMLIIGPESNLRKLKVASMDDGYVDERTRGLGIGSEGFRTTFRDFADPELTDNDGTWSHTYHDPLAHGRKKKGSWLVTSSGARLKAAALLLGLERAPFMWVGKGTRHETALAVACMAACIVLVRSDSGSVHALFLSDGADKLSVQAMCLSKETCLACDPVLSLPAPEISFDCQTLDDWTLGDVLQMTQCDSDGFEAELSTLLGQDFTRVIPLVRHMITLLLMAEGGAFVILGTDKELRAMPTQTADFGYMDHLTRDMDITSDAFKRAFLSFALHSETDKWPEEPTIDPAARGKSKDGAWLLAMDSCKRVKSAAKLVGLPSAPYHREGASSRYVSGLAAAWFLSVGVVFIRSDSGTLHAIVRASSSLHCFVLQDQPQGWRLYMKRFREMILLCCRRQQSIAADIDRSELAEVESQDGDASESDDLVAGDDVLQRQRFEEEVEKLRDGISGVSQDGVADVALGQRQALAKTLHTLGRHLRREGDLNAARPHFEESLQMKRAIHGDQPHHGIAVTLHALGALCQAQGDLKAARPHFEESLQMFRVTLGEKHLNTASAKRSLAATLHGLGGPQGAARLAKMEMN